MARNYDLNEYELDYINANTDFQKEKIIEWYEQFKSKCSNGRLTREQFSQFYKNLIQNNSFEAEEIANHLFQAFDLDDNNSIDFGEFLIIFSIRAKSSTREKLSWMFDLYKNNDRSKHINQLDFIKLVKLIFSIKKIEKNPYEITKEIFNLADRNKTGKISRQEFIAFCTKNETLRDLLSPF